MKWAVPLSLTLVMVSAFLAKDVCGEKNVFVAVVDTDGVQKVAVLAGEYFFDPDHIIVTVNVPVEIYIRKEAGATPHAFVLKAPDAGMDINESLSTEPKKITFRPTKTGNYPFYCDKKLLFFKSHRERGMEGILEVRD
ncbi:MAG TPA: cupredoxin domain-containing protein [Thermodesulfovibrionales bacterium]|nr:cupredoxin domain-containing protein [Thermodesulfovibrionales bacterium]